MSETRKTKEEETREDGAAARRLLRECRAAALSTTALGQPFAALVTPAMTATGGILLLLSDLSEHTRHLRADPRCALFVAGDPVTPNPQTAPRVSITGTAEITDDLELRRFYLKLHPYADLYADFADFNMWQITSGAALYVGGFARATRLRAADFLPAQPLAERIAEEAAVLLKDRPAWLDHVTKRAELGGGWDCVNVDIDGIDVTQGDHSARVSFPQPVKPGQKLENFLQAWAK